MEKPEAKELKEGNLTFLNFGLGERNKFILIKTGRDGEVRQYFIVGDIAKYPQHADLHYWAKAGIKGEIKETSGGLLDIKKGDFGETVGRIWGKSNVYYGYKKSELEQLSGLIKAKLGLDILEIDESKPYRL